MASSNDRVALIDAEILRCKGEMEKVLVEGGAVLAARKRNWQQHSNEKNPDLKIHDRSARKTKPHHDKWKKILIDVANELKRMNPKSSVKLLYDSVIKHLNDAIPHIVSHDIDGSNWTDMSVYFGNSKYFFELIRIALSVVGTKHTIYSVFDAMVKGLTFEKNDWDSQDTYQERSAFLLGVLSKIGSCLEDIDEGSYYDDVIGPGCSQNMRNVYSLLKGESGDAKSGKKSGSEGWKDRLAIVMDTLDSMKPVSGSEWVFNNVKKNLHYSVDKITKLELEDHIVWSKLYTHLDKRLEMFLFLESMPGGIGTVFGALSGGLKSELSDGDWNTIRDVEQRNEKMDTILKTLGHRLEAVDASIYKTILGSRGDKKMMYISNILKDEA
jgi:hypothetical protein